MLKCAQSSRTDETAPVTRTVRSIRPVALLALLILVVCAALAYAERLPFTTYTTAQGLPGTEVNVALEDKRGFLWLGTDKGLSRFDGWSFRTFGKEQGLSRLNVVSLALGADDSIWVGAWGGAYRFDPARGGSFVEIAIEGGRTPLERVQVFSDPTGQVWCVADVLYRLQPGQPSPRFRRVPFGPNVSLTWVTAFLPDHAANLWVAFNDLYRIAPDGSVLRIGTERGAVLGEVTSLVEDRRGRIWAGTPNALWRVEPLNGSGATEIVLRPLLKTDPAKTGPVKLVAGEHGGVWSGSHEGLIEFDPDAGVYRTITRKQGLATDRASPLLIDRAGDLWSAGLGGGMQRLAAEGFSSFGSADGLEAPLIRSIWRRRTGELVAVGAPDLLQRYDGQRFIATHPAFPSRLPYSWGWFQVDMEDRHGNWWIPTARGVVRFSPVKHVEDLARARPAAIYGVSGCFPGGDIFRVYEDARGDIWIGTITRDQETIYRWTRSSGAFSCYSSASLLGTKVVPTAFLDDGQGTVWIAFYAGQIGRFRDGRFECLFDCAGTQGIINGLFLDRRKRLWIATSHAGVIRVDDTTAEHPRFLKLTTENGLSSDLVGAVMEDRFDRIYIGTDRGVDIFEEASGRIHHFGIAEGLPHLYVSAAYADPHGDLWFGTLNGLARFTPPPRFRDVPPPRVLVDMVRVSGVAQPLSIAGEERIDGLVLARDQRDIAIDFVGLPRNVAGTLKFQYRLSDTEPWSPPSPNHSVVLAGLSTGNYRVEIRALDLAGAPSPQTAIVSLRVLAPFYQRSWFVMSAVLAAVALTTAAYRLRIARLVALERQRTRLAMDLHDEMGSRLGSIGLLADVAGDDSLGGLRRKILLDQIAETAAEMGSSLTDIVWSLRPGEITVESLGRHLAEHGRRLFPGSGTAFETRFPETWPIVEMSLAARRNVFLIGLEALHNAARHSGAKHVMLELRRQGRRWCLRVSDDGRGITEGARRDPGRGFGFETVKRRAAEIGAVLDIQSPAGDGTTVTLLFVPHAEDHRLRGHMYIREIWKRIRGMS